MGKRSGFEIPLITKVGINKTGKKIHYLFNYSNAAVTCTYTYISGIELLSGEGIAQDSKIKLDPWRSKIIEESVK